MPQISELHISNSSAPAPGWAYVPTNAYIDPSKAPLNPTTSRKQRAARTGPAISNADTLSIRQQTRLQQRLAGLSQDNDPKKEVPIPGGKGGRIQGKTPATKKILMSAKTIKNHLDDEEAMIALAHGQGGQIQAIAATTAGTSRRGGRTASIQQSPAPPVSPSVATPVAEPSSTTPALAPSQLSSSASASNSLAVPTEEEIAALVSAPPLSYFAARAAPPGPTAPPQRRFCEMCGYWGRARCMRCGERICGLECKETHEQGRCVSFV